MYDTLRNLPAQNLRSVLTGMVRGLNGSMIGHARLILQEQKRQLRTVSSEDPDEKQLMEQTHDKFASALELERSEIYADQRLVDQGLQPVNRRGIISALRTFRQALIEKMESLGFDTSQLSITSTVQWLATAPSTGREMLTMLRERFPNLQGALSDHNISAALQSEAVQRSQMLKDDVLDLIQLIASCDVSDHVNDVDTAFLAMPLATREQIYERVIARVDLELLRCINQIRQMRPTALGDLELITAVKNSLEAERDLWIAENTDATVSGDEVLTEEAKLLAHEAGL